MLVPSCVANVDCDVLRVIAVANLLNTVSFYVSSFIQACTVSSILLITHQTDLAGRELKLALPLLRLSNPRTKPELRGTFSTLASKYVLS